jgi:hypothetical protein
VDQKWIALYLSLKGMSTLEIDNDLLATFKGEAMTGRWVTEWLDAKCTARSGFH